MKSSVIQSVMFLLVLASIGFTISGCSTVQNKELDVSTLDPNAPALPPEPTPAPTPVVVGGGPTSSSSDETSPAPASAIKEETTTPAPASAPAEVPPATPKVEDLTQSEMDRGKSIGTLDDEANEEESSSAPETAKRVGVPTGGPRVFGVGKQRRFIKADQLHIRVQPDRFSKSIGIIYGGDEVHVTIRGDWAKLEEGQWIRSRWLVKAQPRKFRSSGATAGTSKHEPAPKSSKHSKRRSKHK